MRTKTVTAIATRTVIERRLRCRNRRRVSCRKLRRRHYPPRPSHHLLQRRRRNEYFTQRRKEEAKAQSICFLCVFASSLRLCVKPDLPRRDLDESSRELFRILNRNLNLHHVTR